jgi:hypothetical protein
MTTIELMERYISNRDHLDYLETVGLKEKEIQKQIEYKYRRTNPRIDDIERLIEIPGNKKECKVRFYSGQTITVKGGYDDLWIKYNDICNGIMEIDEEDIS